MLPLNAGELQLAPSSREKLDEYFRHFCEGENGRLYGIAPIVFACHASFPLLLSPALANLIWLNFKNFAWQKKGAPVPELQSIDAVTVSDFLLSPLVRPVAARQYEVIPEIRAYLLYLLKDGRWFKLYGVTSFGSNRLQELAHFLLQYVDDKTAQKENNASGFLQVNKWAALAYLQPDALALNMGKALKENLDSKNELGQLRLNLLMDRFGEQYSIDIQDDGISREAFNNLHTYSIANKAILFEQEMNVVSDKFIKIGKEFIGRKNSSTALVELPVLPTIGERLKRKKNRVQRVLSLLIGIDTYSDPSIKPLSGYTQSVNYISTFLRTLDHNHFETVQIETLVKEEATREGIITLIRKIYSNCNEEDICFIYFSGHGINSNYTENTIIPFDYQRENAKNGISNTDFYKIIIEANYKKCLSVFLLSSNTGYYNWVNENDIFIGAVRHTVKKLIQSPSFSGSSFSKSLQEILGQTRGKITYRDFYLWLNFKMENDFEDVKETPVMLTSRENLDTYFLTRTPAGTHDYSLIAFNKQTSNWQLVPEDFRIPLLNRLAYAYDYSENVLSENNRGELFQREGVVFFGGDTSYLSNEQIYKINVAKNPLVTLVYWYGKQHLSVAEMLAENLGKIQFEYFSQWQTLQPSSNGANNESEIERGIKHVRELVITLEGNSDTYSFRATYHAPGKSSDDYVMLSWNAVTEALLIESIGKFSRYMYFNNINLPEYLSDSHLQIEIQYQWQSGQEITTYQSVSTPLQLDNRSFTIRSGKVSFYPLNIVVQNREEEILFYDLYVVVSDFTIRRISAAIDNKIEKNASVTVNMNEPQLFDKILSGNLTAQIKVLLSRDPIRYDFSQIGIN